MDNKNQNNPTTPPPDYSFILNQAPTTPPKKKSKKAMVLLSLVGFMVVTAGALYVFVPRTEETPTTQTTTTSVSVGTPTAEATSKQFIASLQNNQPQEAHKMLSSDFQKKQNLATFTGTFAGVMSKNVSFKDCKFEAVDATTNTQKVVCPFQKGKASITYAFTFEATTATNTQKVTIKDITWKLNKQLTTEDVQ